MGEASASGRSSGPWNGAAALLLLALVACASDTDRPLQAPATSEALTGPEGRPRSYDAFVPVSRHASLEEAIARERFLWLPPGTYTVENPVVLARDAPLFIHGGDRTHTRIVGRDPAKPLFVIERAPLVQIAGVMLKPSGRKKAPDARLIHGRNAQATVLELLDVRLNEGGLVLEGPGDYRLQNTLVRPQGWITNSILVDHPDARMSVLGGDISNQKHEPRIPTDAAYHIRVRRGQLGLYGLSIEAAIGPADFRIDAASAHGPHVLSAVRSEGNNGFNRRSYRSTLVEVPATPERVDLLIKSSIGAWGSGGLGRGRLVSYGGAGTVWLLGNNVQKGASALVEGRAPDSTLVAIGNFVFSDPEVLPVEGARRIRSGNVYFHMLRERARLGDDPSAERRLKREKPLKRFVERTPSPRARIPPVPSDDLPPPIRRPALHRALPGMKSAAEFGARGDGVRDDTAALQALLDVHCGQHGSIVFLPPGRYRVTKPLRYNTEDSCQHRTGGWIAGAGMDETVVERDPANPGSVFVTGSMSGVSVQGLTFRTAAWRRDEPQAAREANFFLGGGAGAATHFVSFQDVRFDGGKYGLGVRLDDSAGNGEGNLVLHSEFRNARMGLGIGDFNVLNNNVFACDFVDNEIAIGHGEEGKGGGIWTVFGARMRGQRGPLFAFRGSGAGAWYFQGLDAEAPAIIERRNSGGSFPLLFDRSTLRGSRGGDLLFDSAQHGGPIFLHSRVEGLALSLRGVARSLFAIRIGGEVSGFDRARLKGPHARLYEISE